MIDKNPAVPFLALYSFYYILSFLFRASEPLKRAGVHLIAVGIGRDAQHNELRQIASQDESVFMLESFDALVDRVQNFAKTACEGDLIIRLNEKDVSY